MNTLFICKKIDRGERGCYNDYNDDLKGKMNMKKIKVLFVGNSYTYFNDMPQVLFKEIAEKNGVDAEVTSVTKGGYKLLQYADAEDEYGKILREKTAGQHYDYAVLQEQSLRPVVDEEAFLDGVGAVKELIDADNFVLYATWGRNDESEDLVKLGISRAQMTEKLSLAYNKAGAKYSMKVAEVGKAFFEYSESADRNDLYMPDCSHSSKTGSALAAKVIFDTIMQ